MFDLTLRNNWPELRSLHRQVDALFNSVLRGEPEQPLASAFTPPANLTRNDHQWTATLAVPGIAPEHIQLDVTGRTVRVRGEWSFQADGQTYLLEIADGAFERTFTLADEIDADKVQANYRHGLLELTLPIKESAQPRRIEIGGKADARQLAMA
jgi:HSP20 family protein